MDFGTTPVATSSPASASTPVTFYLDTGGDFAALMTLIAAFDVDRPKQIVVLGSVTAAAKASGGYDGTNLTLIGTGEVGSVIFTTAAGFYWDGSKAPPAIQTLSVIHGGSAPWWDDTGAQTWTVWLDGGSIECSNNIEIFKVNSGLGSFVALKGGPRGFSLLKGAGASGARVSVASGDTVYSTGIGFSNNVITVASGGLWYQVNYAAGTSASVAYSTQSGITAGMLTIDWQVVPPPATPTNGYALTYDDTLVPPYKWSAGSASLTSLMGLTTPAAVAGYTLWGTPDAVDVAASGNTLPGFKITMTNAGGNAIKAVVKTVPAGDFDKEVYCCRLQMGSVVGQNFIKYGVVVGGSTATVATFAVRCFTSVIEVARYNSITSYGSDYLAEAIGGFTLGGWVWFGISRVGTTLTYWMRADGGSWRQIFTPTNETTDIGLVTGVQTFGAFLETNSAAAGQSVLSCTSMPAP